MGLAKCYSAGVCPVMISPDNKIFIVLGYERAYRGRLSYHWSDFGGMPKPNEQCPKRTASRECYEETMGLVNLNGFHNTLMQFTTTLRRHTRYYYFVKIPFSPKLVHEFEERKRIAKRASDLSTRMFTYVKLLNRYVTDYPFYKAMLQTDNFGKVRVTGTPRLYGSDLRYSTRSLINRNSNIVNMTLSKHAVAIHLLYASTVKQAINFALTCPAITLGINGIPNINIDFLEKNNIGVFKITEINTISLQPRLIPIIRSFIKASNDLLCGHVNRQWPPHI